MDEMRIKLARIEEAIAEQRTVIADAGSKIAGLEYDRASLMTRFEVSRLRDQTQKT